MYFFIRQTVVVFCFNEKEDRFILLLNYCYEIIVFKHELFTLNFMIFYFVNDLFVMLL